MKLAVWICFVWLQCTRYSAVTYLLSIARTHCPFSEFCTMKRADISFKPTDKTNDCCSPCSCDASCWKLGNCCPDSDVDSSTKASAYHFDCISTNYEYFDKPEPVFIGESYIHYRIITSCPESYEDTITVNKCVNNTQFMPESYDDIVVVSNADNHDIIFMNKYCAECNDVENIERWTLVTGYCGLNVLAESSLTGPDLYKYIISECDVFSKPSSNVKLTTNVVCTDDMISICNVTGNWDVYDAEIESACGMWYTPLFDVNKQFNTRAIYKNSFCYHCNYDVDSSPLDVCLSDDMQSIRNDVSTVTFVAILDTSITLSSLKNQDETTGICAINEIYSEIDEVCRRLYCPVNENPFNGQCLANSLDISGLGIQIQLAVIPTEPLIVDDLDEYANQLQRVGNDVLKHMQLARCSVCSGEGFLTLTSDGSYSDIQQIVFRFIITTGVGCKLDIIETSFRLRTQFKDFTLETKQSKVKSVVNILYFDEDTPNKYLDLNASSSINFYLSDYNALCAPVFKMTQMFFCPFVTFTEDEYTKFLNATRATTLMSQHASKFDNKIFRLKSLNESEPGLYATCIENLLTDTYNVCNRCCSPFHFLFIVGVTVAVYFF